MFSGQLKYFPQDFECFMADRCLVDDATTTVHCGTKIPSPSFYDVKRRLGSRVQNGENFHLCGSAEKHL